MVLQGFNSTLTMLDSRNSSEGFGDQRPSGDFGQASPMDSGGKSNRKDDFAQELDDEIPF